MSSTPNHIPWWKHAVCYQVYVRSFADQDGDGIGDLPGITDHLPHLRDLGVDAVWLTPFYTSPQHDHGYDVADYRDVDPLFGSLDDFDRLLATAHELGIKVIVDLVPNHTSDEHEWFVEALAAPIGSPERARYMFRDGAGPRGDQPPNNWQSVFGGPAWTRVPDGQWYLHLFDSTQPDLDWRNPEVGDMFEDVLRFWLDRGVDGFRIDVAHGLFKVEGLPDAEEPEPRPVKPADESVEPTVGASMVEMPNDNEPMWDQPEVHDVYRRWHHVLASYDGDRMAVAEAWAPTAEAMARYVRPDELQQSFNFHWLSAPWSAAAFARVITETFAAVAPVEASPTWVLSNHDVVRHVTRYGGGALGLARARAATLTMLGLPGSAYLYQGEELGLEEIDVPADDRQDPSWFRTGEIGRDGCRVPIPWGGDAPPYEFGPGDQQPWLPQPTDWADVTVAAEEVDPASTLAFYRAALAARAELSDADGVTLLDLGPDVLAFSRPGLVAVLNCGSEPATLPAELAQSAVWVSSSNDVPAGTPVAQLPANTAIWLRP